MFKLNLSKFLTGNLIGLALLISYIASSSLINPGLINAEPLPAYFAKVIKTMDPNPASLGGIVNYTVTITLGSDRPGVTIEDIFSGGGKIPDTDFVAGSAKLDGSPLANPSLYANQLNRVHYVFHLGDLAAGTHTLTYQWKISSLLGCYSSPANEAHLDVSGVVGHVATYTLRFPVKCSSPSPSPSVSPSPSPSVSPSPSPSPSPSLSPSPSPSKSPYPSKTPYPSKSPYPSKTPYPSNTPRPSHSY